MTSSFYNYFHCSLFTILRWFDYSSSRSSCVAQCFFKFSHILSRFVHFSRFSCWRAVLFLVRFLCHCRYYCHFHSSQNLSPSLWDGIYFFVLHCPCHLKMCKMEACLFCWELFQFVSSCYSGDNGLCRLYSNWILMVEVLWIGWLLVSWVWFWCLPLHLLWGECTKAIFGCA